VKNKKTQISSAEIRQYSRLMIKVIKWKHEKEVCIFWIVYSNA